MEESKMPCFKPITAYKLHGKKTENGKAVIVFNLREVKDYPYETISIQCNSCTGCRVGRSREWAIRCLHESDRFSHNMFLTLTFNDESYPDNGSLVKETFTKFIKRLRKKYEGIDPVIQDDKVKYPIRYFHCAEYGERCKVCLQLPGKCVCKRYMKGLGRPHHHCLIFNFDFPMQSKKFPGGKVLHSVQNGNRLYTCKMLDDLWSENGEDGKKRCLGYSYIGDVTVESAGYVARYIMKKQTGKNKRFHYSRLNCETGELIKVEPEFLTMSRRPGIGKSFIEKYHKNVYGSDMITENGRFYKPPRYYDKYLESIDSEMYAEIKERRKANAIEKDEGSWRRVSKEKCFNAKIKNLVRSM